MWVISDFRSIKQYAYILIICSNVAHKASNPNNLFIFLQFLQDHNQSLVNFRFMLHTNYSISLENSFICVCPLFWQLEMLMSTTNLHLDNDKNNNNNHHCNSTVYASVPIYDVPIIMLKRKLKKCQRSYIKFIQVRSGYAPKLI